MTSNDQIELGHRPHPWPSNTHAHVEDHDQELSSHEVEQSPLSPADRGKDAWLFLAACFMLEASVWGFPSVFGQFQAYYTTHSPFAGEPNIPVIGTCALGIMYLELPILFAILKSWPKLRRLATPVGIVIMCLSLALASFAKTVNQLILTQGMLYALGGCLAWVTILFYVEEWFVQRRSLAYGVILAGMGLAGVVFPLIIQWLLIYGHKTTLRACALGLFVLTAPLQVFFKPRIPESQTSQRRKFDISFIKSSRFSILQLGNIIEALGYFLPAIYMPSYARSMGAGDFLSTLPLILINAGSFFGNLIMGAIVGRFHVTTCILMSTIGSTLSVLLIWGLGASLAPLYVFCIIYGLFAGSWSSTWSGIGGIVQKNNENADMGMVFAILSAGKGVGNLVSGPLSEALVKGVDTVRVHRGYQSEYSGLIIFTGITAFFGGCSFAARRVGLL